MIDILKKLTQEQGFEMFGVVPVSASQTMPAFQEWLQQDMQGTMEWIATENAITKRSHPQHILPSAHSVITLAFQYTPQEIPAELLNDPSRGIIARYALYDDYHTVVKKKLVRVARAMEQAFGAFEWKAYVDTGPFLEREWAQRAGLGFIGRNSNLIHYNLGSYLFLAEILVSLQLPAYTQQPKGSCAQCTNCKDKCPTQAIVKDNTIDSRRCISYITIENREAIPEWIRPLMKNRIYGCDICQEVCPYNARKAAQQKVDFPVREDLVAPKLETLLFFDEESFRKRFAKSPITRAKREGFMRNVAVALGNWGSQEAHELLKEIMEKDSSALVRAHAEWGLRQVAA